MAYLAAGWLMWTGLAVAQPTLHLKGLNRGLVGTPAAPEAPLRRRMLGRSHLLVQFAANPTDGQVNDLQNLGATVLSYVPDFALSISLNDSTSLDGIGALAVGRLRPQEKISPDLAGTLVAGPPSPLPPGTIVPPPAIVRIVPSGDIFLTRALPRSAM